MDQDADIRWTRTYDTARCVVAAVVVVALQWAAVAGDGWVALVSHVSLGFHELGHMLLMWAPPVLHAFGGTLFEFGVPIGLAVYFLLVRRDRFAAALMLGWEAVSLRGIAAYIADAPVRVLPLLGGQDGHDWAFLLSEWGVLGSAEGIATFVEVLGFMVAGAGLGLALHGLVVAHVKTRKRRMLEARLKTLPVREPRRSSSVSVDMDQ